MRIGAPWCEAYPRPQTCTVSHCMSYTPEADSARALHAHSCAAVICMQLHRDDAHPAVRAYADESGSDWDAYTCSDIFPTGNLTFQMSAWHL